MKRLASSQSDRKAKETRDQTGEEKETDCQSGFLDVKIMDSSETHQISRDHACSLCFSSVKSSKSHLDCDTRETQCSD
jgi:hypothetical protein